MSTVTMHPLTLINSSFVSCFLVGLCNYFAYQSPLKSTKNQKSSVEGTAVNDTLVLRIFPGEGGGGKGGNLTRFEVTELEGMQV